MNRLPGTAKDGLRGDYPALFTKFDRPAPAPEPEQPAEPVQAGPAGQPQGAAAPQPDGASEMVAELQTISRAHPIGGFRTGEGGLWIGYREDWWRDNQETWKRFCSLFWQVAVDNDPAAEAFIAGLPVKESVW